MDLPPNYQINLSALKIKKHSVKLFGHATSITLEDSFWQCLKEIAGERGVSLRHLIECIDQQNPENLSSALRVYVLESLLQKLREQ